MKRNRPNWPKKLTVIKMEPKKDIFDLFKENEHKVDEQPAPHVWRRLERKLDHKKRNNRSIRRPMQGQIGIAAAILLLFTVITIMLLALPKSNITVLAHNENMVFEELSSNEADQELLKVVQFTRKHQSRLANPVKEGDEKKLILPATDVKVILLDKR